MRTLHRVGFVVLVVVLVAGVAGASTFFVDVDGDGLAFAGEYAAGTDPFAVDSDDDGLSDGVEREVGTNPLVADSDDDGLADGTEREVGTNPLAADSDDDGLRDARERDALGTNATRADTDTDGLDDGAEVEIYGTDPTSADTDADGLADDRGIRALDTDPTVTDSDGDGLGDGVEVRTHGSNPLARDSDGDGLDDGREVTDLGTNPTSTDSDGDALSDGLEVETYDTDPTVADTDGDGLGDGVEAASDGPLAPADPLARDVFVELDYMRGDRPSDDAIALVVDQYADAPITNPDGSTGIDLHVVVDDEIPRERRTNGFDSVRLRFAHFDNEGKGYHHALAVADARIDGDSVAGFATTGHVVVQTSGSDGDAYTTRGQAHVLMHELGHSLGLSQTDYAGIDSFEVSHERYASVMNYDSPWEFLGYSRGEPFDDWAYIDANMYAPAALPLRLPVPGNANATATAVA